MSLKPSSLHIVINFILYLYLIYSCLLKLFQAAKVRRDR